MPDALHFTDDEEANRLVAQDPLALLVGFVLDAQVTVQKAFAGPLVIRERLGLDKLDAGALAAADLDAVFREKPAVHRYPGNMAKQVHAMAVHVRDEYDGNAARIWEEAADTADLRRRLAAVPGLGDMKIKSLGAVLAKHYGVKAAAGLVPPHLTLGDVDSPQALAEYQAAKKLHKKEWNRIKV